jgi:4-diphosphocytidyl-2-C-methyl-D-erythritol kinase
LGADVASCVTSRTAIGTGTGADLMPAEHLDLQGTPILLVNPRLPVATGPIFQAWDQMDRGALRLAADIRADLLAARNDLQQPAIAQCPAIADILSRFDSCGPWLARMSGSGGTCFALFDSVQERDAAAAVMASVPQNYWVLAGELR